VLVIDLFERVDDENKLTNEKKKFKKNYKEN